MIDITINPTPVVNINDDYYLNASNGPVTLSITIGYGCNASSLVSIDNDVLPGDDPSGQFTRSFTTVLGSNLYLKDKVLRITHELHDILGKGKAGLHGVLSGGTDDYPFDLFSPVETGSMQDFYVKINFIQQTGA